MGRRHASDSPRVAVVGRTAPHLVRSQGHAAILSAVAHCLLDRAPALGRRHARLPSGQHSAARRVGRHGGDDLAPARHAGGVSGGGRLRPASGPGRIGGLDHRAEKHPLGRVLSGRRAGLSPIRPRAKIDVLLGGAAAFCARAVEQNRHGDAASGFAGDFLVAARPAVVAAGRSAASALLRHRRRCRPVDRLGGADAHRRKGRRSSCRSPSAASLPAG